MSESLYGAAIRLYPPAFYARNRDELLLTFRDLRANMASRPFSFWIRISKDLMISLTKENLLMFKDRGIRRVVVLQSALIAAIVTLVAMLCYTIAQQVIRQDANYPQVQIAQDTASRLAAGTALPISESNRVDPSLSLAPFVIVFDSSGHPISSTAVLGGNIPVPPEGVFRYMRTHREDRVTWQPRPEVRIATVIVPYNGAHPGFVLAGRSMTEIEASEQHILHLAILGWLALLSILGVGTVGLLWLAQQPEPQPSAG